MKKVSSSDNFYGKYAEFRYFERYIFQILLKNITWKSQKEQRCKFKNKEDLEELI